MKMIGSSFF